MNGLNNGIVEFPKPKPREPLPRRQARILIVNDQDDILHLLSKTLAKDGQFQIIQACDGGEAIRKLRSEPIDLLITDIHMPQLDGWRLARMVRSGLLSCPATTPIIVASATFSERIAETTAREFEVNRFFSLPLENRGELLHSVQTLLAESNPTLKKPSLLIIEDDPDTAVLAERMLRGRFEIDTVSDGCAGLESWRKKPYDLVLLDVMLPKLAGPEVLRTILAEDPQQAIIIMTADGSAERCESLMLEGAVDFLAKPFQANQLRQICEIAVRRADCLISNRQFSERTRALKTAQSHYDVIADAHQRLLDNLSSVVFELDPDGRLRFLNRAWEQLSHFKTHESIGCFLYDFLAPLDRGQCRAIIRSLAAGRKQHHEQEVRLLSKRGETVWTEITLNVKQHPDSGIEAIFGHLTDITERKLAMAQLEHLAIHDSLTGLYNRRYFEISLEHMAAGSARSAVSYALLYIDLDHFQMVNDAIGHREGDMVLKEVATLLSSRTRESDLLCRIGGDEFAILLTHADAQQATAAAYGLIEVINQFRYRHEGREIAVGCSIGISLIDGSQSSGAAHLLQADKASFAAKNRGRNLVHIYDPTDKDSDELRQSIDWAHRVRQAISEERLELYIQPILELATGKINHYEALLRLHTRDPADIITPGIFIPAVEKAGQIHMLDRWVIKHAIQMLATQHWLPQLAINLSGHAFADPDLLGFVNNELSVQCVDPKRIIFEITETASVANINETQRMIDQLQSLGCRFALDDFGTGFCSFHYLRHLPTDYLKLDGSYIKHIADNDLDLAMVRSMNDIAHILGKKTIAECVETPAVLHCLREIGVDYVQGHGIGHALPLEFYSA